MAKSASWLLRELDAEEVVVIQACAAVLIVPGKGRYDLPYGDHVIARFWRTPDAEENSPLVRTVRLEIRATA